MLQNLRLIVRWLLALAFCISAIVKLVDPTKFYAFSSTLPVVSSFNPHLLLVLVVSTEFLLSAAFVFRPTVKIASLWSMVMLFVFTLTLFYASITNGDLACGCFGEVLETSPEISIVRNIFLLLLSAFVLVSDVTPYKIKGTRNE